MKIDLNKLDTKNKASNDMNSDHMREMLGANDIRMIKIDNLIPFEGQPFKPYTETRLQELADDISTNGILSPILIRPISATASQILAGHNRVNAAKLAGLTEVPCIIKNVDDETAKLIMLNTNLNQRDQLLPSEKAYAYKMQLETLKRKAGRPSKDINNSQVGNNISSKTSSDELAEQVGESKNQIFRFIRLTYLIPGFLDLVDDIDNQPIPFTAGVALSYVNEDNQLKLLKYIKNNNINKISSDQAESIKACNNIIDDEILMDIFNIKITTEKTESPKNTKMKKLSIPADYFGVNIKTIQADDELLKLLAETIDKYYSNIKEG